MARSACSTLNSYVDDAQAELNSLQTENIRLKLKLQNIRHFKIRQLCAVLPQQFAAFTAWKEAIDAIRYDRLLEQDQRGLNLEYDRLTATMNELEHALNKAFQGKDELASQLLETQACFDQLNQELADSMATEAQISAQLDQADSLVSGLDDNLTRHEAE